MRPMFILLLASLALSAAAESPDTALPGRWTPDRAWAWRASEGWLVGSNYVPASAVNQLEMWQADTFDPDRIDRELGWAEGLGLNAHRVFLHYLAWKQDPGGFFRRVDRFLDIAAAHRQRIVFVVNDSVWNPEPKIGAQPAPVPHRHNSGWVQSPGAAALRDPTTLEDVGLYVRAVLQRYGQDRRVVLWDLLNEPDNGNGDRFRAEPRFKGPLAFRLLKASFAWAREVNPRQPLTAGLWTGDWTDRGVMGAFNLFQADNSDVITFHAYEGPEGTRRRMAEAQGYGRPVLCTEYMARPLGSTFQAVLPLFREAGIGAFHWGLVDGKTNTKFPWDSWERPYPDDPPVWFHEVLRADGTPYDAAEAALFRRLSPAP